MDTCYFIGHRQIRGDLKEVYATLEREIETHIINYHVEAFYVGDHGAFDHMVQRALVEAKKRHPEIVAQVALAYHPAIRPVKCPQGLDGTYFPQGQESALPRYAIVKLNERMVRNSEYLIAYVNAITDGSYNLLTYARRREKRGLLRITNLG